MSAVRFADITPDAVVVTIDVADVLRSVGDAQLRAEMARRGLVPRDAEAAPTADDIRGARGLLGWSLARLAAESGVSVSTLKRMEDGRDGPFRPSKTAAVRRALEQGGVAFRSIQGVTHLTRAAPAPAGSDEQRVAS